MTKQIPHPPRLYSKAVKHLESNGFEHCDFSNYFPDGEEYGGISLSWIDDDLCIKVRDSLCARESPSEIIITKAEEHLLVPVLDVLMFTIKLVEVTE